MLLAQLNWWAVIVSALSAFALGAIWYGPLFGKAWQRLSNLTDEDIQQGHPGKVYGGAFVLNLVAAFGMGMVLQLHPAPDFASGFNVGILVGLAFIATTFGINYLFAMKPLRLYLIDAGYMIALLTVMGTIIGGWR
ncbi:DUF1761 domain-containing protein [Alteromonas ponticola]|uniref:DUF1761 domain-containing protein n=1 Tax=Alteromonas ponticola TaxID=2720613 RepID=A0ABX1R251_9ALTE|nr:DUF1761 domain-containing protein [Alteromonas ponticola]NMH59152.1 DUF1761 domain-containing protein [Alteromonas ponticola]